MNKIDKSQARAIVGGGFFSKLKKALFGLPTFGVVAGIDPVSATIASTVKGARDTADALR
jgi:hypothetical protein